MSESGTIRGRALIISILCAILGLASVSQQASAAVATSKKFSLQGFVSDLPDGAYNMRLTFAGGNTTPAFNVSSVHVANGVFSVELDATVHTALNPSVFYSSTGSGNIQVKLEIETAPSVMEDFGFIPLTSVANAWVAAHAATAEAAVTAGSALMLSGVTVNVPSPLSAGQDGMVIKYNDTTKKFELDNPGAGAPTAGTGIVVSGSQVSVDAGTVSGKIPILGAGGKLPLSMIATGGTVSGSIAVLDTNGKIPASMIYTGGTMSGSIPTLDGNGYIPAANLPPLGNDSVSGSMIAVDSINTAHIADDQITHAKMADNSVDTAEIVDGAVTDAKLAGSIDGSKLLSTSTAALAQVRLRDAGELRFMESVTASGRYISLRAPANLSGTYNWTLPSAAPTANNQILKFNNTANAFYWDDDAGASGGVSGPGASTANGLARWNGTAGTTLKDSGVTMSDTGDISNVASIDSVNISLGSASGHKALMTDGVRNLVESTTTDSELNFLSGVTSNLGAKVNKFTAVEAGFISGITSSLAANLNGLTANIQTQLNTKLSGADITGKLERAGDTMIGNFGLNYANATPDRAAYLDSNRVLRTSANVDSSELDYLDGVTSNLGAKINKFTAVEAGYIAGVTSSMAKINSFTATEATYLSGLTAGLAANLNGLTGNVQTQIINLMGGVGTSINKAGDTMTGNLGTNGLMLIDGMLKGSNNSPIFKMTSTNSNTFVGANQTMNTSGVGNTTLGDTAGQSLASGGNYNTFVGRWAGRNITTGTLNTALGSNAGANFLSGSTSNTLVGAYAGEYTQGGGNTIVGVYAGSNGTAVENYNNTLVGCCWKKYEACFQRKRHYRKICRIRNQFRHSKYTCRCERQYRLS